jgi:ribosomal protein S18 acetylase RimI-like enzyme
MPTPDGAGRAGLTDANAEPACRIVRLQWRDLPAFRRIRLAALQQHPDSFGSSFAEESRYDDAGFARMLPDPPGCTLGAFRGDALAGIANLYVPERLKQRHKGLINGVYVAPQFRRTGLARSLLQGLLAEARRSSLRVVQLSVTVGNEPARRLYAGLGFQTYGIEPRALMVDGRLLDEELMALALD